MKLPNNTDIVMALPCGECNATIEVDATLAMTREGANAIRAKAEAEGWMPLMLGKKCVNVLCPQCVIETLGEEDDDETEDMDTEDEGSADEELAPS